MTRPTPEPQGESPGSTPDGSAGQDDRPRVITRPGARSWLYRGAWLAATLCFAAAIAHENGAAGIAVAALAGLVLTWAGLRRRSSTVDGAAWSASADLLRGGRQFPGQVSLTTRSVVWRPARSSRRRGVQGLTLDIREAGCVVRAEAGPGLVDVVLQVRNADGVVASFLTHRHAGLTTALEQMTGRPGPPATE